MTFNKKIEELLEKNNLESPHIKAFNEAVRKWIKENPERAMRILKQNKKRD